jgi:thiamine biosynthesis lipoprotein ApbE
MKKAIKLSVVACAIALSFAACGGKKSGSDADSVKTDSSSSMKSTSDTTVKVDTAKKATDTSAAKVDTVSKTMKKTSEVKKTVVKKSN